MDEVMSRRDFISGVGCGTLGIVGIGTTTGTVRASNPVVRGQIVPEVDAPAQYDELNFDRRGTFAKTKTDANGNFEISLPERGEYTMTLYKGNHHTDAEALKNGIPQVYKFLDPILVNDGTNDLGEIPLPKGYLVDVRVVDENGTPLSNATPEIRHFGWGFGDNYIFNENGYLQLETASFTGIEIRNNLSVAITPPPDRVYEKREFKREFSIDGPSEIVATLTESEAKWNVTSDGQSSTSTEAKTTTQSTESATTTASEPSSTTTTTAEAATTQTQENTATPDTSESVNETQTTRTKTATASSTTSSSAEPTTNTTPGKSRGFFSNSDGQSEFVSSAVNLTTVGFALSVVGLGHQMIKGR